MLRRVGVFFVFLRRLFRRLVGVDIARTAGSLSFTTLFGLVPLFTVAFTYVARFPIFVRSQDALESLLLRYFLPGSGSTVRHYIQEFTANSAQLKGIGTVFVVVTAVLLVVQVDQEINASGARGASGARLGVAFSSTRSASLRGPFSSAPPSTTRPGSSSTRSSRPRSAPKR